MARAYVEFGDERVSVDEYENAISQEPQIVEEYTNTLGPGVDDLYMMLYVQNQRLYDLLGLLISLLGHDEALQKVMELHRQGRILAPEPFLDNTQ